MLPLPATLHPLITTAAFALLAISQSQEGGTRSPTLQKQMPSSEIRGGCFTLPACSCVLRRAGCFPSMKIKGEMSFPFCTWQRMLFCALQVCTVAHSLLSLLLWDPSGLTRQQRTLATSCRGEPSPFSYSSSVSWQLISKVPPAGELQGCLTTY